MKLVYSFAIVRRPGKSYKNALSSTHENKSIDVEKAQFQHLKYAQILTDIGLTVIHLPIDESYPDGCFVQDPFVTIGKTSFQTIQAAKSRKGEGKMLAKVLSYFKKVKIMKNSAYMDGGDVLLTPKKIFIGISERTNKEGIKQFIKALKSENIPQVIPISVTKCLHLMTGASYIGKNVMLVSDLIDHSYFKGFSKIYVPQEEEYAVNCLNFGNIVIVPKGYKYSIRQIQKQGFQTIELDMSEFKKADGGLTCLSSLF